MATKTPTLKEVQAALRAVWTLYEAHSHGMTLNANPHTGVQVQINGRNAAGSAAIIDALVDVTVRYLKQHNQYHYDGAFNGVRVIGAMNPDEWPLCALAQAAARIRAASEDGEQPDIEDTDLFPSCPSCGGKFHGDGCRAGCVWGLVLPVEPGVVKASDGAKV